jgi:hypothetical protein
MMPYALYSSVPVDHPHCRYRQLDDSLLFRYFTEDNTFGRNSRAALTAVALSAAARILNRPSLMDPAYQQIDWILGFNPWMLSFLNGVGPHQVSPFSPLMGIIPGGLCMGAGGDAEDMPAYFGFREQVNIWQSPDEYYGYQSGHFIWAVAALAGPDSAS